MINKDLRAMDTQVNYGIGGYGDDRLYGSAGND